MVQEPNRFAYREDAPVKQRHLELVEDVLDRWWREQCGETDVGRTLPHEYRWFVGRDGENWFRKVKEFDADNPREYWDWRLESPYEE